MDPMKKRIRHAKRLAEAAVPLKHHWETPGPGKKLPPKLRVQSGNRSQYLRTCARPPSPPASSSQPAAATLAAGCGSPWLLSRSEPPPLLAPGA